MYKKRTATLGAKLYRIYKTRGKIYGLTPHSIAVHTFPNDLANELMQYQVIPFTKKKK